MFGASGPTFGASGSYEREAPGLTGSIWLASALFRNTTCVFDQYLAVFAVTLRPYARLILGIIAIPKNVDRAFETFNYVPYPTLSHSARLDALEGKEDFLINASGGILVKGLDRCNEENISLLDWLSASRVAVKQTRHHLGDTQPCG
ncbi:hypothetical protein P691DRAFT_848783 [Macrolepiota fuliginosa MF-IS2]|uniref:Uncharacterized protein n=1 Tax=Macrolepiota fuliginosa MF-IS2 TaxID=1400762 RepID=A0A9P5X290_9AGAR|nr:hypothetical protein P691DRAFT_848783 [Macrolepiota fuliginosa MF-IS2]